MGKKARMSLRLPQTIRSVAAAIAITAGLVAPAVAADIGDVEIIAPAGPGGGYDQLARGLQAALEETGISSGVQVINVPGAGGTIGLAQFINGTSQSERLLVVGLGMVGAIKVNASPVKLDQTMALARLTGEYQPIVVAADSPIKTLADLKAKFDADPGSVSWGGFALGSPDHLLSAMTVKAFGGDVRQMNYIVAGAGGEMLSQVLGGHITVATGGLNEFAGLIQPGQLRALAISSPERLSGVEIPTFKEQGFDVELVNWRGVMTDKTMDAGRLAELDAAIGALVATDAWKKLVAERGWVDLYQNSQDFTAFLETEQPRVEQVLQDLGLGQ